MQVADLCIRLLMNMLLLLLVVQLHISYSLKDDAGFPQVSPNRQQHFEHATISVSCEGLNGLTGWRVPRRLKEVVIPCGASWDKSTGTCTITAAYPEVDSGEYWCENRGIRRSNSINITVTAGFVVLESPVLPVKEGDNVTLRCRVKQMSFSLSATFYKDGVLMQTSSTGEINIDGVSKSDEGLYKCSITGAGESPASWLIVREPQPSPTRPPQLRVLLIIFVSVLLVFLLVFMGLLQCTKEQTAVRDVPNSPSHPQPPSSSPTVSGKVSAAGTQLAAYSVVTNPRKEEGPAEIKLLLRQEDPFYYTIE